MNEPEVFIHGTETQEKVEDIELWQMRALFSERSRLATEMEMLQLKFMRVEEEVQQFNETITEKYGRIEVLPDGTIKRQPEVPQPVMPATEQSPDEDDV
jgi:fructose-bisphosphate aldolase class 1